MCAGASKQTPRSQEFYHARTRPSGFEIPGSATELRVSPQVCWAEIWILLPFSSNVPLFSSEIHILNGMQNNKQLIILLITPINTDFSPIMTSKRFTTATYHMINSICYTVLVSDLDLYEKKIFISSFLLVK